MTNQNIIEASDWKNTRVKVRELFMCMAPAGTRVGNKGLVVTKERPVVMYGGHGEYWTCSMKEAHQLCVLADGSEISAENMRARAKKKKGTLEAVIPWTKVKTKAGTTELKAVHIKGVSSVGIYRTNGECVMVDGSNVNSKEKGWFIVGIVNIHGNMYAAVDVKVESAAKFAVIYTLHAFQNIANNIDDTLDTPADLFEIATASDARVDSGKINELADAIERSYSGIEVATANDTNGNFFVFANNGANTLKITYDAQSAAEISTKVAKNFEVRNGETGEVINQTSNSVAQFKSEKGEFKIGSLISLIKQ